MKLKNIALVLFAACAFSSSFASAASDEEPILESDSESINVDDDGIMLRSVSCTTHKYNTAGCIRCSGSGEVRIVIDCKAPQVTDYVGRYVWFSGETKQCGECNFGINSVSYQAR